MDLLIDKADYVLTLDDERRIIKDGSIVIEDKAGVEAVHAWPIV